MSPQNEFIIIGREVVQTKPIIRGICQFSNFGTHVGLIGDYCEFLNNKYFDKNINQEWPPLDREKRIKWHKKQIEILKRATNVVYNQDGYGVEEIK